MICCINVSATIPMDGYSLGRIMLTFAATAEMQREGGKACQRCLFPMKLVILQF